MVFLFYSCSPSSKFIGIYGNCDKHYLICSQIELKNDNTFKYYSYLDIGGETILTGRWEYQSRDSVKLNTYNQPINKKTTYTENYNSEHKGTSKITFIDSEGPIEAANVFLPDQKIGKSTDYKGSVVFEVDHIKSLKYSFIQQTEVIDFRDSVFNEILVVLKDNNTDMFFTDKIVWFKKNKLHFGKSGGLKKVKQ